MPGGYRKQYTIRPMRQKTPVSVGGRGGETDSRNARDRWIGDPRETQVETFPTRVPLVEGATQKATVFPGLEGGGLYLPDQRNFERPLEAKKLYPIAPYLKRDGSKYKQMAVFKIFFFLWKNNMNKRREKKVPNLGEMLPRLSLLGEDLNSKVPYFKIPGN